MSHHIKKTSVFDANKQEITKSSFAYEPQSPRLRYVGTAIEYQDGFKWYKFDLSKCYLPSTTGHPATSALSDTPNYVNTALAMADMRILRAKGKPPIPRSISREIYFLRHVLDWLRNRGIYRLADASQSDTEELLQAYAKGGWILALSLERRWEEAINSIRNNSYADAFHYRNELGTERIEALSQPFWLRQIGWGGQILLPESARLKIESATETIEKSLAWRQRIDDKISPPTENVLRNFCAKLNNLAWLDSSVDHLKHQAINSIAITARNLSKKPSTRTRNLSVENAVTLITKSFHCLYEISPHLINLLKQARQDYPSLTTHNRKKWLHEHELTNVLSKAIGKPIDAWTCSQKRPRSKSTYTVEEIISAVQGACAIIIAAMNGRRHREICDKVYGLRVGDLRRVDEDLGIYQSYFYIEKTYQDRHLFYVNQSTADAMQCLEKIKVLSDSLEGETRNISASLFSSGRWSSKDGPQEFPHFSFTFDSGKSRSLTSFFLVASINDDLCEMIHAHMFRRFFALLYYYKYDHAELKALRQHLRHRDIGVTKIYVTDPSSRPLAEDISSRLGDNNQDRIKEIKLDSALASEFQELEKELSLVEKEKLEDTVLQIIRGEPTGGGFSRLIRKAYRAMAKNISFATQDENQQAKNISDSLYQRGYQLIPMSHGQCHAPEQGKNLQGVCSKDGILHREHASGKLCGRCPFHFNNVDYLDNLKEDLSLLDKEKNDFLIPPLLQQRAAEDFENLDRLIKLTEINFASNQEAVKATKNKLDVP